MNNRHSIYCFYCFAGYYCPRVGMNSSIICTAGTYSKAQYPACLTVPAGIPLTIYISMSKNKYCWLSIGYYAPIDGSTNYTICSSGSYSSFGASVCTLSPAGLITLMMHLLVVGCL